MKKIVLVFVSLLLPFLASAQIMNCGSFCVLAINNIDTVNNEIDVTIYNGDSTHVNYPTVILVDSGGDTIANIGQTFYFFAHPAGDTVVHTIPTTMDSIPAGFTCTVYLTDQIYDTTCSFAFPMSCTTGINELAINNRIDVWPNPATESFSISLEYMNGNTEVEIVDVRGVSLKRFELVTQQAVIPTSDLKNGMYFIIVKQSGRLFTKKLMICGK
jgi:hypothetical protein